MIQYYVILDNYYSNINESHILFIMNILLLGDVFGPPGRKAIVSAWNEGPLSDLNKIKKGQELGYFQMGSTVILLFPESISGFFDLLIC